MEGLCGCMLTESATKAAAGLQNVPFLLLLLALLRVFLDLFQQ
jgi:hypothetical protein